MGKYNPEYFREYYQKNRVRRSLVERCRRYGTNLEEIERLFRSQKGRCGICREVIDRSKSNSWHLDHNHKLEHSMRGILCCHCNRLLGAAKDNVAILESAIRYLDMEFVAF